MAVGAMQRKQRQQKAAKKAARKKATQRKRNHRAAFTEGKVELRRNESRTRMIKLREKQLSTPGVHAKHLAQRRERYQQKSASNREEAASAAAARLKYVPVLSTEHNFLAPPTSSIKEASTDGSSLVLSKVSVEQTGASVASPSVDPHSPKEQTEPLTVSTSVY